MPYADPDRQRAYQRKWRATRRATWFVGKSCRICGSSSNLQLDHKDGKKKTSHRIWSWRRSRRLRELRKCQVLCSSCHLEKTLQERPKTAHGRAQMYQRHRCRCPKCRAWKREDNAKRKPQRSQRGVEESNP